MGDVKGALEGREGAEEHESQSAKSVSCNESDNGGNEVGIRHSEGGKDVMSVVWVAMSPQRRVESGREVSIPGRVLSHLRPGIKPIFQPQDNKAQG